MKKQIALILMLALALTLCACGTRNEEPAEPAEASGESAVTVGISLPGNSAERFYSDGRYLQEQFEAAGYQVILQYTDAESGDQDGDVLGLIEQGARLLLIAAVDSDRLSGSMAEAKAQGIPVVAYDRLINGTDAVSACVTFDNYAVGALQGTFIRDALDLDNADGPFNLEIAAGSPTDPNAAYVYHGGMDVLQPYIDAGKLTVPSGETSFQQCAVNQWDTALTRERFEGILAESYSDGTALDAVLSGSDSVALGVVQALAKGYAGDNKPVVTGQDANIDNLRCIAVGVQAMTVYKDFAAEAAAAFAVSTALLEGKTPDAALADALPVQAAFDGETYHNGVLAVPSYLLTPDVITAENLDKLAETGQYQWDAGHTCLEAVGSDGRDLAGMLLGTWEGRCTSAAGVASDDGQDHRWEYRADGTYVYYVKDGENWTPGDDTSNEFFLAGDLLCTRWVENGVVSREWWEIAIDGDTMHWSAPRQADDGSTVTVTFEMTKVEG